MSIQILLLNNSMVYPNSEKQTIRDLPASQDLGNIQLLPVGFPKQAENL